MTVTLAGSVKHPKIYGYTTPDHEATSWVGTRQGTGLIKVGYTEGDVDQRIRQQLQNVIMPTPVPYSLILTASALRDDGRAFTDHEVHQALRRAGVHRAAGEWFESTVDEVRKAITAIKANKQLDNLQYKTSFALRPEQRAAVQETATYIKSYTNPKKPPHFLWNAKMRFGKTFTTYQLSKEMGWTRVLVLTYKPAVEGQWRTDLLTHEDFTGWRFHGRNDDSCDVDDPTPLVWFASFQDVLGTDENGNPKLKNEELYLVEWDVLVIDEYHFGAWRDTARSLYLEDKESGSKGDPSEAKILDTPDLDEDFPANLEATLPMTIRNYLYLSGTPFRALTQGEFLEDQVFNWTYGDEQRAKTSWSGDGPNPYAGLPRMNLLVYEMPESLREVALNNRSEFSLTEFFRTGKEAANQVRFTHETEVQKWLDLLRGQEISGLWANVSDKSRPPLPYEDLNLLQALQHTVWYLPSVDACRSMAALLAAPYNTFYRDYQVIIAAGTSAGIGEEALPPVRTAIGSVPQDTKTITLTCGKLLTGVTVPAWTGIFMLRELKSPESYFQAAFRVQSPWVSTVVNTEIGGQDEVIHKEQCFVFDFSPNRALQQIVDYATRLTTTEVAERNDRDSINEFMEFLPVLSFDGYAMVQLDASDVIDYLTRGISSSMLARRWNSPELITLDVRAMEALLNNPNLLASLEQMELFRDINITQDLEVMVSTNKELRVKTLSREPLDGVEKEKKKEAGKRRETIKKRLQRFITRIPAFMYLTDERESTIKDIILQIEPELFEKVTGLTLSDFAELVNLQVFNDSKMNDAVWKFRTFEEPSLRYGQNNIQVRTLGGWNLRRDERFARLIDGGAISPGDNLVGIWGGATCTCSISEDYGLLVNGVRYESPDMAAEASTSEQVSDGWTFWRTSLDDGGDLLQELFELMESM